jgi:hypothetical protein
MTLDYEKHENNLKKARIIYRCIARNRGEYISNLSLETSLNNELGLDGDDVDDLLEDINRFINIDWKNLNYKEYFRNEGEIGNILTIGFFLTPIVILAYFLRSFFQVFNIDWNLSRNFIFQIRKGKRDFKIKNLIIAGLRGKWIDNDDHLLDFEIELIEWQKKLEYRYHRRFHSKI